MKDLLWYDKPSDNWMEGLPIGNGRLAGMVSSTEECDIIQLNHEWLWRGVNRERDNIKAAHMLEPVRDLIKSKDFYRATLLANTFFSGVGGVSGIPCRNDAYQTAGELRFKNNNVKKFLKRSLDIKNGIVENERETDCGNIKAYFVAHPRLNNIICHFEGDVSGVLSYSRVKDENAVEMCDVTTDKITYKCKFINGISYTVEASFVTDGKIRVKNGAAEISDAGYLTVFINIATSVKGIKNELRAFPAEKDKAWTEIVLSHKKIFSGFIERFSFDIECESCNDSTDLRILNVKNGGKDTELTFLYFNYGRYLLISSSVCGELPANLQGKWNDSIDPPWESDYHFDINLQMNYWMAEQINMPESADALLKYCESFVPHAQKAAQDLYGCRGIYLPLSSDAWGRATPEQLGWGVWIGAAPWLAQHFWWHYIYSMDKTFLKERAYPFFKEVARFYEDYLVEDKNGVMQIMPSQSPENTFVGTGSVFEVSIGASSAMDVQLAYDLLGYAIKSAEILETDKRDVTVWKRMRDSLPEFKIGKDGRLLEWDCEYEEKQPGHRHLSHLYGVYPSDIFTEETYSKQFSAAKKSLEFRLAAGGGYTGWSRAWVACLYARFGDAEKVYENITEMIKEFATISLLDLHPPRIFQIDGNLGAVAAIIESAAQFTNGKLHLLKALPNEWKTGKITNLCVPGGHTVNIVWKNGEVLSADVTFGESNELALLVKNKEYILNGKTGETKSIKLL